MTPWEADTITAGLRTIVHEVSVDRPEFREALGHNGADQLLEGLASRGYLQEKGGRFTLSPAGFRRLEAGSAANAH